MPVHNQLQSIHHLLLQKTHAEMAVKVQSSKLGLLTVSHDTVHSDSFAYFDLDIQT
jgi:hypothetical protein